MAERCEKCGATFEPGDVKCPACGAELPSPAPQQPKTATVFFAALLPLAALVIVLACLGGIVFAAMMFMRAQNRKDQLAIVPPPPIAAVDPTPKATPAQPTVVDPPQPPTGPLPSVPRAPLRQSDPAPTPEVANAPEPTLTDLVPPIQPPGQPLVLRGTGLALVNKVLFISSHGATAVPGKIIYTREDQVIVTVPEIATPDYGIVVAAFSPGGVAILADQHTGATPWGTDGHLHDTVVSVHPGDEISVRDGMVVLAKSGSEISVGDNCIVFMHEEVKLHRVGRNCQVYAVAPALRTGVTAIKALNVNFENDAFRVKPGNGNDE